MEKLLKYETVIIDFLKECSSVWSNEKLAFEYIIDNKNYRYLLVCRGKVNNRYIHNTPIDLAIVDGKIWIYTNNTEEIIPEELVKKGVAPEDIVLGYLDPEMRYLYAQTAV